MRGACQESGQRIAGPSWTLWGASQGRKSQTISAGASQNIQTTEMAAIHVSLALTLQLPVELNPASSTPADAILRLGLLSPPANTNHTNNPTQHSAAGSNVHQLVVLIASAQIG